MKEDYTHVAVILDRTGSMEAIRDDTIGGFNAFLQQQREVASIATVTLVQFDSQNPYEVIHRFALVGTVPELTRDTFVPRASTPLLDAIGYGIGDLETSLAEIRPEDQPGKVVLAVITDGQENASQRFTKSMVSAMIQAKQEAGWQFVFLSADLDAIDDALSAGIQGHAAMAFDRTPQGTREGFASASARLADYRNGTRDHVAFQQEDRDRQGAERRRKDQR